MGKNGYWGKWQKIAKVGKNSTYLILYLVSSEIYSLCRKEKGIQKERKLTVTNHIKCRSFAYYYLYNVLSIVMFASGV